MFPVIAADMPAMVAGLNCGRPGRAISSSSRLNQVSASRSEACMSCRTTSTTKDKADIMATWPAALSLASSGCNSAMRKKLKLKRWIPDRGDHTTGVCDTRLNRHLHFKVSNNRGQHRLTSFVYTHHNWPCAFIIRHFHCPISLCILLLLYPMTSSSSVAEEASQRVASRTSLCVRVL